MLCPDVQAALLKDPRTLPRAEVAAVARHTLDCPACLAFYTKRHNEASARVHPIVRLACLLEGMRRGREILADPEARSVIYPDS